KTGVEVIDMVADVTKKDDVDRLITRAEDAFGGVDILVANAGGPPRGNLEEMSDEQWYGAFDTTVMFVVRLIRGVLPSMKRKKWGRILTIQSVSVKQPVPGLPLSNAVRPGTAGMVKTLSEELGAHNITINVVCPGKVMTDRLLGGAKQMGLSREELLKKARVRIVGFVMTSEQGSRESVSQLTSNFPVYRGEVEKTLLRIVQTRGTSGLVGTVILIVFSTPLLSAARLVLHRLMDLKSGRGY